MKYRKKPVVVEAMQFTGDNIYGCLRFCRGSPVVGIRNSVRSVVQIETLEGIMTATPGDWIIKGVAGEFYPCRNDIFEATYEAVEE